MANSEIIGAGQDKERTSCAPKKEDKNKKCLCGNVRIVSDPYFERTSHLFGIVNGIQNAALALIEKGLGHYNLEDIFADRANITQQFYFEMIKQKLEIRDKE